VRQNLWDLLNQLRFTGFDGYFWVDALSIDQTSNSEKNHQVAIMGSIYTRAMKTIAWLGNANEKVAENIHVLHEWLEKRESDRFESYDVRDMLRQENFYIAGFKYILSHPYWTRTWILQEYILSSDVEFWCGDEVLRAAGLKDEADDWVDTVPNIYGTGAQTSALTIIVHGAATKVERYTLAWLLNLSSDSACVDPRDRIYALLSLMPPQELELWDITPDYARSTQDLFEHLCSVFQDTDKKVGRWVWTLEEFKKRLRGILLLDAVEEDGQGKARVSGVEKI